MILLALKYWRWIALAILIASLAIGIPLAKHHYDATQQKVGYDKRVGEEKDETLKEQEAKAHEGLRRLEAQDANQRAQNEEMARLRDAAARNAADADRVREQSASAARQWAARLADSPTGADLTAASAAIDVCTDVRGRLDAAAGKLAAYADTARAAGSKCASDYDALTKP